MSSPSDHPELPPKDPDAPSPRAADAPSTAAPDDPSLRVAEEPFPTTPDDASLRVADEPGASPPSDDAYKPSRRALIGAAAFGAVVLALGIASYVLRPGGALHASDASQFVGRFHSLALHLPIGALLLLALAEALTFVPRLRARAAPVADFVLPFLSATAAAAFVLGVLLASGGGYPNKLLVLHRTFTLIGLGFIAACALLRVKGHKTGYRAALLGALGTISFGAHVGGSMTHGDGYLVRYAPAAIRRLSGYNAKATPAATTRASAAAKSDDPRVFADILQPLLQEKCGECHGAAKTKGGLRFDSFAALMQGGEHPTTISPGKADASELVRRLLLPAKHEEHMPPDGKPALSPAQIALLRFWIDRGAKESTRASEGIVAEDVTNLLRARVGGAVAAASSHGNCPTGDDQTASATHSGPRMAFRDNVAPVIRARCGRCHGDSFAAIATNGKAGVDPATLLARVTLPITDPKHMPPAEESQPTAGELELIAFWVSHGASETMPESELPGASQSLRIAAATGPNWISALAKIKPTSEGGTVTAADVLPPKAKTILAEGPVGEALYAQMTLAGKAAEAAAAQDPTEHEVSADDDAAEAAASSLIDSLTDKPGKQAEPAAPKAPPAAVASAPAVDALKVRPHGGGCGSCAVGSGGRSDDDRSLWLFGIAVGVVVLGRQAGKRRR